MGALPGPASPSRPEQPPRQYPGLWERQSRKEPGTSPSCDVCLRSASARALQPITPAPRGCPCQGGIGERHPPTTTAALLQELLCSVWEQNLPEPSKRSRKASAAKAAASRLEQMIAGLLQTRPDGSWHNWMCLGDVSLHQVSDQFIPSPRCLEDDSTKPWQ